MPKDRILLFIPMYNCEKQIVRVLGQLTDEVCPYLSEAIIVNNRSTDGGEKAVREYLEKKNLPLAVRLLRNDDNYGLGGSHKVAFAYAVEHGFDYVIVLHGDDQGDIANLLPYLKNGSYKRYDCLLGARFMPGSRLEGYSWFRTLGNVVYDILFSLACRRRIYDLGSGLNMYRARILENEFYFRYSDSLVFNYCMILGSAYYGHRMRFFPMVWREEDQVSNVKMASQAVKVLKLLCAYIFDGRAFAAAEHRENPVAAYRAETVYENNG